MIKTFKQHESDKVLRKYSINIKYKKKHCVLFDKIN